MLSLSKHESTEQRIVPPRGVPETIQPFMHSLIPVSRTMGMAQWATLLALSLLWGASFYFVAVAVTALPPLTVVALRVALAALALWAVMAAMGLKWPQGPGVWRVFGVLGLLNVAVPFGLIAWGQTLIPSGLASILNAATPLFGVLVAHLFTANEKITPGAAAGVLIGFTGVAVMIGPAALLAQGVGPDGGMGATSATSASVIGQLAILAAALCYALGTVYARLRLKPLGIHPITSATAQVAASAVFLAPVALIADQPWALANPSLGVWGAVVALALASTSLAYILYFRLMESTGATNILLVTFLIPISAILLGVGLLNEVLAVKHFAGMAIIGLGLAAIDGRPYAAVRRLLG